MEKNKKVIMKMKVLLHQIINQMKDQKIKKKVIVTKKKIQVINQMKAKMKMRSQEVLIKILMLMIKIKKMLVKQVVMDVLNASEMVGILFSQKAPWERKLLPIQASVVKKSLRITHLLEIGGVLKLILPNQMVKHSPVL